MRISIDRTDPGFCPGLFAGPVPERYTVTLDGVPQDGVVTADEDAGTVVAYERDPDGGWIHAGGVVQRFVRTGDVIITRDP